MYLGFIVVGCHQGLHMFGSESGPSHGLTGAATASGLRTRAGVGPSSLDAAAVVVNCLCEDDAVAVGTFTGISPRGLLLLHPTAVFFIEKSSGGCCRDAVAAAMSSAHELVDDTSGSSQYTKGVEPTSCGGSWPCTAVNALVRRRPAFGMDDGGMIGSVKSPSSDCCRTGRPLGIGTDAAAANAAAAAAWSSRWCIE